ncbi:lipopolysaccharide heptosyltransferase-1 [Salmonella sp. NCTC 11881]|nr:lipopolysaccharide heptosyltransferase-1 [Salmonella sp. NCTC 11881]
MPSQKHFLHCQQAVSDPYAVFLHATTRDDKHWPEAKLARAYRPGGQHRITDKASLGRAS